MKERAAAAECCEEREVMSGQEGVLLLLGVCVHTRDTRVHGRYPRRYDADDLDARGWYNPPACGGTDVGGNKLVL